MEHSDSNGITGFRVSYIGMDFTIFFPWSQDKNIDIVLKRVEIIWDQFSTIMEAIAKTREIATMKFEVPQN